MTDKGLTHHTHLRTMTGNAKWLRDFIALPNQFIIPVYQRNYDWLIGNCDQLLQDILSIKANGRPMHFFGSIVSAPDATGYGRIVIDGQQRLTTVSLLLMAGVHSVNTGVIKVQQPKRLDEVRDLYLTAPYCNSERKIKLVPIADDMTAYDRIYDMALNGKTVPLIDNSKVTRNYNHFCKRLERVAPSVTFDDLLEAVNRLQIVAIDLTAEDDAQLIFESLNSTGLALQEADKIRNHLLMSLSPTEQQTCFANYWQPIESATKGEGETSKFLRIYLTIRQQLPKPVKEKHIYFEWKHYMKQRDRKAEMADLLEYAHYYERAAQANFTSPRLAQKMRQICNIESEVPYFFFIPFLRYAERNKLSEDEIWRVIDLVENYYARRIVCNMPTNALTQVFCAIHRDVLKSMDEYKAAGKPLHCTYADILVHHLLRRDGVYAFPTDKQFVESLQQRDVYRMNKPYQVFLFERLENAKQGEWNAKQGEWNDVATAMNSHNQQDLATIEHIMPQTLTKEWKEMLGPEAEAVHERYLHTIANLTLTGYNATLSNRPFIDKCNGNGVTLGYKDSKYRLTHSITKYKKWTAEEMEHRFAEIITTLRQLYPMPATAFVPLPRPVDEVTLDDQSFSPTNRKIKGFRLFGVTYDSRQWVDMLEEVVRQFTDRYPDEVEALYDHINLLATSSDDTLQYYHKVSPGHFVLTATDNKSKLRNLRDLFDGCNIHQFELTMMLESSGKAAQQPTLFPITASQDNGN